MQTIKNCRKTKQQWHKSSYRWTSKNCLLKPTNQSAIITQEVETIEKPNIDRESVITEHTRTVTKLSKPIKQPIIPQKPENKIKEYTESPWFLLPAF